MSTDLYRVRVLDLDPTQRKVTFRVFLVYYDWSGVPTDPSFFFRILWDEADARFGGGGPLGEEVDVRHYLDEAWVNENTQRFVERVTRLSLRNDPLPAGKTPPTFVYDGYTDEDSLTQGDYEVIVTDARWIAHLKVGQTWQTTSYETRAVMPKGRATRLMDQAEEEEETAGKKTAKRGAAKKTGGKKTAAKKTASKGATKKTAAKKTASKGAAKKTASKGAAKKTAAKKTASKGAAKKTAAKKTAAKKTAKVGASA
ncbi:MAG TPA: hypothetical protein VGB85_18670 [Nannocystis sp.]